MSSIKNEEVFIKDLVSEFPQLREEILDEDYKGILTLQIGSFREFTQNAIDKGDQDTVKRSFAFVEANINKVEYKVENSLVITYLGKLKFNDNIQVEKLIPKKLKNILTEIDIYSTSRSKNEKFNKFMKDL